MNAESWIAVVAIACGAVGVILKGQHSLITKLLADKWYAMEKRQDETDERLDDVEKKANHIDRRLAGVEAVCKLRTPGRPDRCLSENLL